MNKIQESALSLARKGIEVYPVSNNSKVPLKGTRGYLDATRDERVINGWFEHIPRANLGMRLDTANLLVVDVDHHGKADGMATVRELNQKGKRLLGDTYIERTPNNGLHYFFKLTKPISIHRRTSLYPAVDVLHDFVMSAPSEIDGCFYEAIGASNSIKPVPQWLLDDLLPTKKVNGSLGYASQIRKNWTGKLLDDLVTGTDEGSRNDYLTSLLGKVLRTGCQSDTAYELLMYANEQLRPPLPDKEVNMIFKSILKRV